MAHPVSEVMHALNRFCTPPTKTGAACARLQKLSHIFRVKSQAGSALAALFLFKPRSTVMRLRAQQPFSCSISGSRSLDLRRMSRRRSALHAIACSHLLKTPRYLLGHT